MHPLTARYYGTPNRVCRNCDRSCVHYAKGLCKNCYSVQVKTGRLPQHRTSPRTYTVTRFRYCIICLKRYRHKRYQQLICSLKCRHIFFRLKSYVGQMAMCQRCRCLRLIRCKQFCNPCYVMLRLEANAMGVYGRCGINTNKFRHIPGILSSSYE